MTANVGYATLSIIPSAKGMGSALGGSEFTAPMDKLGADSASSFGGGFTKGLAAVGIGAAAVAAIGVGVGAALFSVGSAFDEQFDKIRVGTGETGTALEGLEESFKNVLKSVPTDFDSAGTAITNLNQRLGLTGEPLEALAGQFINLSRITETDLGQNVESVTRLFGDWGIATEDQAGTIDELFRATQASGIGLDQLAGSVVQFGAPLRNLGFGFEESIALLSQFEATGVNTETVFAGLKAGVGKLAKEGEAVPETFRRIVDEITALGPGTEATALAIELFGQRAGPDLADAIAGGKFEIDAMLDAITAGSDTVNGAAADTADFAEKWQMFKNKVLVGLQPLAEQVFKAVGNAMDTLGPKVEPVIAWFSEKLPVAFNAVGDWWTTNGPTIMAVITAVFAGIQTGAQAVVAWFEANWPKIQATIAVVVTWLQTVAWPAIQQVAAFIQVEFANLVAWFEMNWPKIQTTIQNVLDAVKIIVETWVGIVKAIWEKWGADIVNYVVTMWESIKTIIQAAVDIIRGIIDVVTSAIKGDWAAVWEGIKTIFRGVWDAIQGIVDLALAQIKLVISVAWDVVKGVFTSTWDGISSFMSDIWNGIVGFVESGIDTIVGFITGLPGRISSGIGKGFDSLWESFKSVINRIIDGINSVNLPGVTIGGWDPPGPGPSIPSFTTPGLDPFPYIGRLHTGGWVPGGKDDESLAILQGGELVLDRSAANVYSAPGRAGFADRGGMTNNFYGVPDVAAGVREMELAEWRKGAKR